MIPVGESVPDFTLPGIHSGREGRWRLADCRGQWVVLFFYPADFTFVCPTEVVGFHREREAFRKLGVEILGVSVDSVESHRAWARELGGIDYRHALRRGCVQRGVGEEVTVAVGP
jgi:alkyl hydroperoxide reductase subunit AhpC